MRVLLTSRLYPSSAYPARGTFVHNQVCFLSERCEVQVLAPLPYFPRLPGFGRWSALSRVGESEERDGLNIRYPRYFSPPRRLLFDRAWRAYLRTLNGSERFFSPDLIHAHLAYPDGRAAVEYGARLGLPVVISVHGHDVREIPDSNPRWRDLVAEALVRADAVIASSRDVRERVLGLGVDKGKVWDIPQGVDCVRFTVPSARRAGANGWRLLYAGRFDPKKGIGVLLDALHLLRRHRRDISLKLVGASVDGGMGDAFRQQVARLDMTDCVEFCDAVPWAAMPEIMAEPDVFILPSFYDSFGIVLIEAMACGVPVVATRCGGPEDLVDEATGRLVQVGEASSLAAAIEEVLLRYGEFDPAELRRRAENFDYRQITARMLELYESVLAKRTTNAS